MCAVCQIKNHEALNKTTTALLHTHKACKSKRQKEKRTANLTITATTKEKTVKKAKAKEEGKKVLSNHGTLSFRNK